MRISSYLAWVCLFNLSLQTNIQACDSFGEALDQPRLTKEDANAKNKQIQVYTETIEISTLEYAEIMTKPSNSNNHTALRNKLIEQVKASKAKLVSNQSIIVRSGENATTESIREFIYETEYEPPEGIPAEKVAPTEPPSKTNVIIFPPTPTAFETRNLGSMLEVETILGDDEKTITLRFEPRIVKHVGYNVLAEWNTVLAQTKVQEPIFYTMRLNTTISVIDGQFILVGTHSPEVDGKLNESKKLLVFVKASVLELRK